MAMELGEKEKWRFGGCSVGERKRGWCARVVYRCRSRVSPAPASPLTASSYPFSFSFSCVLFRRFDSERDDLIVGSSKISLSFESSIKDVFSR